MPWPWLIALGAVLFLVNLGATILKGKRRTAISVVLFAGMAGLAAMYLINMATFKNLTVDYYWWWWIIHLWVEGAWELIAAAVAAYLLMQLTGVERGRMHKWLYVEVALVLFTGIIGIGHHYYWIGTPSYWLLWGAVFSVLEPVPIALMAYDALVSMRQRKVEPANRVAWYWLGGSVIGHLLGAGVWGVAITLPQINKWTHGTQVTASHGHFAFYGAFGMLALAAIYTMVPAIRGAVRIRETRGLWAFWLMTSGMLAMVLAFTIAGVLQVYLHRMVGLDFMTVRTQYMSFWMFWVLLCGGLFFLPGVSLYLWDLLRIGHPREHAPAL
jgi:nitric oxide reductase subunit B